jgi:limonene 1,2-monooxygenase
MTGGRALFGTGPGALPSDARTFGIDKTLLRDRQDEALGVIVRLLNGERLTYRCEWFQVNDAQLQLLPLQEKIPMTAASSISPSGMKLAGKYGMGALSIASTSLDGLQALPLQWSFAEQAAKEHGKTVDRRDWRVLISFHLAESKKEAQEQAVSGLHWWHNEYIVRVLARTGAVAVDDKWALLKQLSDFGNGGSAVIGTPDEMVTAVRELQRITGGFGVVLGFVHDWANRENSLRSWELFARYVMPELNGYTNNLKASADFVADHREELSTGRAASILNAVKGDKRAEKALQETMQQMAAGAPQAWRPGDLPVEKK